MNFKIEIKLKIAAKIELVIGTSKRIEKEFETEAAIDTLLIKKNS